MTNYNNAYGYNPYQNQYVPNNNNNYYRQPQMNQYAFVNGIEGAKSFQLQPNQNIMLMDSDNPICYMKQSNDIGQSTLRYFKLVEVSEQELRNANQVQQNQDYVLKSDFDALVKRIDELTNNTKKGGVE